MNGHAEKFVRLVGEASLFEQTVTRLLAIDGCAGLVIVAGLGHRQMIAAQLAGLRAQADVLLEPAGRDSCAAMAAERGYAFKALVTAEDLGFTYDP